MNFIDKLLFTQKLKYVSQNPSPKRMIWELAVYLVFLSVVTIVTLSSRSVNMFYFNKTIEKLFLSPTTKNRFDNDITFSDLVTDEDFWSYMQSTFLISIAHFDPEHVKDDEDFTANILLGPPRMRQIRVKGTECILRQRVVNLTTCYGEYTQDTEDTDIYMGIYHSSQKEAQTYSFDGIITSYQGAGYIQELSYSKDQTGLTLQQLKNDSWINEGSRMVLTEFVLYNSHLNLFCNVKFILELSAFGGGFTSYSIQSLRYYVFGPQSGFFLHFCTMLFVGFVLHYTFQFFVLLRFRNPHEKIFKFSNLLDAFVLMVCFSILFYIIWHYFYVASIMESYTRKHDHYLSIDIICHWNMVFIDAMGLLVFLVWIRLLKYTQFNTTLKQFQITLQNCAKDLFGFSVIFAIVFVAYAYLAVLLFGLSNSNFADFRRSVLSLMRTILGDLEYSELESANAIAAPIFFLTFIFCVFFILLNMFLAIINDTYSNMKEPIEQDSIIALHAYINSLFRHIRFGIEIMIAKFGFLNWCFRLGGFLRPREEEVVFRRRQRSLPREIETPLSDDIVERYFAVVSTPEDIARHSFRKRIADLEIKVAAVSANIDDLITYIQHNVE